MSKNPPTKHKPVAQAVRIAIVGAVQTIMLHPDRIAPSPTNPRKTFPEAGLAELGQSLVHDGQVQAITVRPITVDAILKFNKDNPGFEGERPGYELVVGERRWRAAKLAGIELRAEVRELSDFEVLRIQIIENLHREEVHPLEEAQGYEYLLHHSKEQVTIDQVADEVGKSRSYIHKRMRLTALCPEAREKFYAGAFEPSTALLIARLPTPSLQIQAIEELDNVDAGYKLSYRDARDFLARRYHLRLADASFDIALENLVEGCGSCAACPKRTGNQPMLFEDVADADVCTDPDCFAAKKSAGVAVTIAAAKAKGWDVVEGDEAKAMKPHSWRDPEGFTSLDEVAYRDGDGKGVTYADLLAKAGKKAPKPFLFLDPYVKDALPDTMITEREADQLLQRHAPAEAAPAKEDKPVAETPAQAKEREERAQRARLQAIHRETDSLLKAAIAAKADKPRTKEDLILVIFALADEDLCDKLLQAAGVQEPAQGESHLDSDTEGALLAKLLAMGADQLGAIALRMAVGDLIEYYAPVPFVALEAAAKAHKINLEGIRKKAEAIVDKDAD